MQQAKVESKPYISPTHRLSVWAMAQIGLPTDAHTKALEKLGAEYDAINAGMAGLSNVDARAAFKAMKRSVETGKLKPEDFIDFPTMHRRFSQRRQIVRAQLLAVSKKARSLQADIFEQAAPKMPALAAKIGRQERDLAAGQGPEAKSLLVQSIELLETHLKLRAKRLRETDAISHPCHLFDA